MKALGIIPARYASTRLPAKPLQLLGGKPLIQWVYENATQAQKLDQIIVATDDRRILDVVQGFGGTAVLTPESLASGTDRCAYVARQYPHPIVANIQGDEPFLSPALIDETIAVMEQEAQTVMVTTARRHITTEELHNPNVVKVLVNRLGQALYFSRQNIPFVRDPSEPLEQHPALVHTGLYIYRRDFLLEFTTLPVTVLERLEKLEQLRALENGYPIRVIETEQKSLGIDTWEDLQQAQKLVEEYEAK